MLTAEKLYLLLTDDNEQPEAVVASAGTAMNGAVITDLVLAGRLQVEDEGMIRLAGAGPCADPVLAPALQKLEKKNGQHLGAALRTPGLCRPRLLSAALAQKGAVEHGRRRLLGLGREHVRVVNDGFGRQIGSDLHRTLTGRRRPERSDPAMLALLQSSGRLPEVLPEDVSTGQIQEKILELAQTPKTQDPVQKSLDVLSVALLNPGVLPAGR